MSAQTFDYILGAVFTGGFLYVCTIQVRHSRRPRYNRLESNFVSCGLGDKFIRRA